MLEVKNINVYYGKLHVIWDFSLIVDSKAVGLFGSNGAGKTTLINTIVGLVKPASGQIIFNGKPITNLETHQIIRKGIAIVPQERELFPFMSVLENLNSGAAYIPNAREKMEENLEFAFEIFPILKQRVAQLAGTLSGGEQRMLAMGRALMANPKILILDEPSVGLQPSLVSELFEKLNMIKKEGVSILLTEQNVRQGLKVIDRGYVIENGRTVLEDNAENLTNNDYVKKSFLGL
ncbi:branched-chain amino acid ABC transporter ATP-binding protein [Candidatus Atribacteria bacterium HGW-Atribacteria-1]|nr:MAG: branched-chain amino acid ABC transporter ATP-binding protein [Candidatus Atribacteria bacterium HGW-Atribacteria-1]